MEIDRLKKASLYYIWQGMQRRCDGYSNKEHDRKSYSDKGITYCERWRLFENFLEDMYQGYEKGLLLDRIDNNGNYEPSNCRWVTIKESNRNKSNTIFINYEGKKQPLSEVCEKLNLPYQRIIERYSKRGIRDVSKLLSPDKLPNSVAGRRPLKPCIVCGTEEGTPIKGYSRPIRKLGMCTKCYQKYHYRKKKENHQGEESVNK